MKIAVNTRLLLKDRLEGIGHFTAEIFKGLVREHPEVEWYFIFDRAYDETFVFSENVKPVVLFPPTRHPILWHLWFQWSLPRFLRKEKIDLFISPDGMIPLWGKTANLSVIHDLNYEHQPKNLDPVAGGYMRYFYPKFANKSKRLATVSKFCKDDLAKTYAIDEVKIDVIPNGYGDHFKPLASFEKKQVRESIAHGEPYFIHLGALNPRKNLEGLMEAFELYRNEGGICKLLIVGEKMRWTNQIEKAYQNNAFQSEIHFTGRLSDADLARVLASAEALCLVSHFEGFGIPILEAFAAETPVICSNNTAMPEVAGDAALLVDSNSAASIKEAMLQIESQDLQAELIRKGKVQLQKYSWEQSWNCMWESIQKCLPHG